jgi:fatty-acyl-CoA synthase
MLLKDPAAKSIDLSKWKVIIGGAALPKTLALAAMERGIDIFSGYGMSETCPVLSISTLTDEELLLPPEEQVDLRVRTGTPIALVSMKVVDMDGREVPRNDKSVGEVVVRAPWLTQGYLKDSSNSEKLWDGGWLHTQDVACRNAAGSFRITDRTKDVIKVGGEWLSSLEIEDILCAHPAVAEAAIIGRPDATWGETPHALIVVRPNQKISEKELIAHVKGYVDRGLLPREAILLKTQLVETIDKTSVGKVNKVALRSKYL